MENIQYAEELVREFLVFRGFTNTLQTFESELGTDIGKGFQVDKILDLIFSVYVPKFQAEKLVGLLSFFKKCFSSASETVLIATLSKLEVSILRYYIAHAIQSGRRDKVVDLFEMNGNEFLQRGKDWTAWFAIPYIKNPNLDPEFRIYFSKEWCEALRLSVRNFFIVTTSSFTGGKRSSISNASSLLDASTGQTKSSSSFMHEDPIIYREIHEACALATPQLAETVLDQDFVTGPSQVQSELTTSKLFHDSTSSSNLDTGDGRTGDSSQMWQDGPCIENGREVHIEEEFPEVKVDFQETFLGHTSPISRCRFSASGNNIASASIDGTVRIWTYDSSTPASRYATIYCGAEIMSLDWECKSDCLLLIGTADGGIKACNVDAKRAVCDLSTTEAFPSPVVPIFVSAVASKGNGSSYNDNLGFASLTVWNMKTWNAVTVLPLGKYPPAITSLCFNHNGKILAASATDGMIHMFDMAAGLQITGWPAHDSAISSLLFGPDETSIFSLGSDGKIFEWSLQNQGQVLWSRNCSRFCDAESSKLCRHEMALDANGRRLLVTSGSARAPIYQVRGQRNGLRTLPHTAAIAMIDWHLTMPIFLD
nr:wd repeat-containing protein 91 like [Quercus suber]